MNITTQPFSTIVVLDKATNEVLQLIDQSYNLGFPLFVGNYQDYLVDPDKDLPNHVFQEGKYYNYVFIIDEVVKASDVERINQLQSEQKNALYVNDYEEYGNDCWLVGRRIMFLKDDYTFIYYQEGEIIKGNLHIGSTYHQDLQGFVAPPSRDDFILNELTYEYEPDPNKSYDLHGDGQLYTYNAENLCWYPV